MSKKPTSKTPVRKSKPASKSRKPRPVPPHGSRVRYYEARSYNAKCEALADCMFAGTVGIKHGESVAKVLDLSLKEETEKRRALILAQRAQNEAIKEYRLTTGNQINRRERDVGYGRPTTLRTAQKAVDENIRLPITSGIPSFNPLSGYVPPKD